MSDEDRLWAALEEEVPAHVAATVAVATGTIRALSTATRQLLHERIQDVAGSVAQAHGCTTEVTVVRGEPVLENDPALVAQVAGHLSRRGLRVSRALRSVGSDDFSFYAERWPSLMLFVGTDTDVPLHSDVFAASDEDVARVARSLLAGYLGATEHLASATTTTWGDLPDPAARPRR